MKIKVQYYANLREQAGRNEELVELAQTPANAADLYQHLLQKYPFTLAEEQLKVAINEEYSAFTTSLKDGDTVVFIPPVAGG